MNEFEAAYFFGDYTSLRQLTNLLLQENVDGILTPEEFVALETTDPKLEQSQ